MEPESSLPCSEEPSTGPYPGPDQSNPQHPILSTYYIVMCYLLTRRIICGLRILYLDLLDIHQAELQSLITFPITSHEPATSSGSSFVLNWRKLFLRSFRDELLCRTPVVNCCVIKP
jgi:hypothetical protein